MAVIPKRAEVWLVDLGLVAKVRPCVVISIAPDDPNDRQLVTVIPHTTSGRGSRFEVPSNLKFLRPGVFDAQNLITIPRVKLVRRLGLLPPDRLFEIEGRVETWLGLTA
ncbi:PemK-like protein [Maioricimonas rarisocia]|uniref:PemK-like protein n=1 Tax=Maioricimonas rarisocia TaxID=2528026 RepID=A0A517Z060_9PLAN|nr:PemK-like protein [Maioricimonas rarisocia]